jgi:hypothetical protein
LELEQERQVKEIMVAMRLLDLYHTEEAVAAEQVALALTADHQATVVLVVLLLFQVLQ